MSGIKIIKAKQGFIRQTARKVRRTANLVRQMTAGEATTQLGFMPYAAAREIKKLIESAMANARNNFSVDDPSNLLISQLLVDDGPIMKRFRAASRGRAAPYKRRTASISLVLSEMNPAEYSQYLKDTSPKNKKMREEKKGKKEKAAA